MCSLTLLPIPLTIFTFILWFYDTKASPTPRIVEGLSAILVRHLLSLCPVCVGFHVWQQADTHLLIELLQGKNTISLNPSCTQRDLLGMICKDKQQPRAARPYYIFINIVTLLPQKYPKLDNYLPRCFSIGLGAKHQALSQLVFWALSQIPYGLLPTFYKTTQMLHEARPKYSPLVHSEFSRKK